VEFLSRNEPETLPGLQALQVERGEDELGIFFTCIRKRCTLRMLFAIALILNK
jgi:hypothetical protein